MLWYYFLFILEGVSFLSCRGRKRVIVPTGPSTEWILAVPWGNLYIVWPAVRLKKYTCPSSSTKKTGMNKWKTFILRTINLQSVQEKAKYYCKFCSNSEQILPDPLKLLDTAWINSLQHITFWLKTIFIVRQW